MYYCNIWGYQYVHKCSLLYDTDTVLPTTFQGSIIQSSLFPLSLFPSSYSSYTVITPLSMFTLSHIACFAYFRYVSYIVQFSQINSWVKTSSLPYLFVLSLTYLPIVFSTSSELSKIYVFWLFMVSNAIDRKSLICLCDNLLPVHIFSLYCTEL